MSIRNGLGTLALIAAIASLAACSGGGGGGAVPATSSSVPSSTGTTMGASNGMTEPTATPTPLPTANAFTSGTLVDLPYDGTAANPGYSVTTSGAAASAGAPIARALVFVGPVLLSGSVAPTTLPAGFASAVTATNGAFTVSGLRAGHYALTIFAPAPHVTVLHQDLIVTTKPAPDVTYFMTAPSASEAAWFAQENLDRATFHASPTVLDESVVEAGRYWAQFMQLNHYFAHCIPASRCVPGDTTPAPATYGPQDVDPQHRMAYFHGFSSASEGENIAAGFGTWQTVDAAFMAEQAACPNASPANCTFTEATGHFLNIVDASYVWTGFGIAALAGSGPYYDQEFALLESSAPSTTARTGMRLVR